MNKVSPIASLALQKPSHDCHFAAFAWFSVTRRKRESSRPFVGLVIRRIEQQKQKDKVKSLNVDEAELIDKNDEQQFLDCANYLSYYGLAALIANTEAVASEVLKGKELTDSFNASVLHDAIIHILETLMIIRSPHYWVGYLMPEDAGVYKFVAPSSSGSDISHATKFELLMGETRAVLSSTEFANVVNISLRALVNGVLEDPSINYAENNLMSGIPLPKLVPRIEHMSQRLLKEPNRSRYIQIIRSIPEVELFITLLYSSTPT